MKKCFLALGTAAVLAVATSASAADVLIIRFVMDGGLSGGVPKTVVLENIGDAPANLADYSIALAANGAASFGTPTPLAASGTLPPGYSFLITTTAISATDAFGIPADLVAATAANFNGNDTFGLFKSSVLTDIVGVLGVDGTGAPWEYLDGYMIRNAGVTAPNTTWTAGEWTLSGIDATDAINTAPLNLAAFNRVDGTIFKVNNSITSDVQDWAMFD